MRKLVVFIIVSIIARNTKCTCKYLNRVCTEKNIGENPSCSGSQSTYVRPTASGGEELCVDGTWQNIMSATTYASCYLLKLNLPASTDGYYKITPPLGGESVTYCLGMGDPDGPFTRIFDLHDFVMHGSDGGSGANNLRYSLTVDDLGMSYNKLYIVDRGNTMWDWWKYGGGDRYTSYGLSTCYMCLMFDGRWNYFNPICATHNESPKYPYPRDDLYNTTNTGKICKVDTTHEANKCFQQFKMHLPSKTSRLEFITDAETISSSYYSDNYYIHDFYIYAASCIPECIRCLGVTECISCDSAYPKLCPLTDGGNKGSCETSCEYCRISGNNTYEFGSPPQCGKCDISCLKCAGSQVNQCTHCESIIQRLCPNSRGITANGTCVLADCSTCTYNNGNCNSYPLGLICEACTNRCFTCKGTASSDCLSCKSTYKFCEINTSLNTGKCISSCPTDCQINSKNTYLDTSDDTCYECDGDCETCSSGSSNECLTCPTGELLCPSTSGSSSGSCTSGCNLCTIDTYQSFNISTILCKECDSTCYKCSAASINDCTECLATNKVCPSTLGGSVGPCVSGCSSCTYSSGTRNSYLLGLLCRECHPTCFTCKGTASSDCLSCKSTYKFCEINTSLNTGKCISSCPTDCQINSKNTYLDTSDDTCYECDGDCETCSSGSSNECLTCPTGELLCPSTSGSSSGSCTSGCNLCTIDTYQSFNISTILCKECDSTCYKCSAASINDCTECLATNKVCPSTLGGSVGPCVSGCSSCTYSSGTRNSYLLGLLCRECHPTCFTCKGTASSDCLSCKSTYKFCEINTSLNTGKCISSCPTDCQINSKNSYLDTSDDTCYECAPSCLKCSNGSLTDCTECIANKYLQGSRCVDYCYPNYYVNMSSNICLACQPECKKCSYEQPEKCLECWDESYGPHLYYKDDLMCYLSCPSGTFEESLNRCKKCPRTCRTCNGNSSCTSCISGYSERLGLCRETCKNGIYSHSESRCVDECKSHEYIVGGSQHGESMCMECNPRCLTCSLTASNCTSCPPSRVLENAICISQCHFGFYYTSYTNSCLPCFHPCLTCYKSPSHCIHCLSGYVLYHNQCLENCPNYHSTLTNFHCHLDTNLATYAAAIFMLLAFSIYLFALVRKYKYRESGLIDVIIYQSQVLQYISISFQMTLLIFQASTLNIMGTFLFTGYILTWGVTNGMNTVFAVVYIYIKDRDFITWKVNNPITFNFFVGGIFCSSFQMIRLHSTPILGYSKLQCTFTNNSSIRKSTSLFSRLSLLCISPLLCLDLFWIATNTPDIKIFLLQSQQVLLLLSNIGIIIYDEITKAQDIIKAQEEANIRESEAALNGSFSASSSFNSNSSFGGNPPSLLVDDNHLDTNISVNNFTMLPNHNTFVSPLMRHKKLGLTNTNIGLQRRMIKHKKGEQEKLKVPSFHYGPKGFSGVNKRGELSSVGELGEDWCGVSDVSKEESRNISKRSLIVEQILGEKIYKEKDQIGGSRDVLRSKKYSSAVSSLNRLEQLDNESSQENEGELPRVRTQSTLFIIQEIQNEEFHPLTPTHHINKDHIKQNTHIEQNSNFIQNILEFKNFETFQPREEEDCEGVPNVEGIDI